MMRNQAGGARRQGTPGAAGTATANVYSQSSDAYAGALAGTTAAMGNLQNTPQAQAYGYGPSYGASQGYNAATVGGTNLNPYLNPYTQTVIDNTMRQMGEQRSMALNDLGANATAAGAFGGMRHGVAEAQTYAQFNQQSGDLVANLNQANFQNAQGMAQADVGAQNNALSFGAGAANNAALANQSAYNTAQSQYAGAQNNASLANQNMYLAANNQLMGGAAQLGGLSQQGFNYGNALTNQQMAAGAAQQQTQQQLIDAGKQQFAGFAGQPQNLLQMLMQAASGGNMGQGSVTQTTQPGVFDYVTALATLMGRS